MVQNSSLAGFLLSVDVTEFTSHPLEGNFAGKKYVNGRNT
jgi:hypothetical protein